LYFILAVQHERKPIVDRKQDTHKSSTSENDQEILVQGKSRQKKETAAESMNYLSLFQLNPSLLMHAAATANPTQSYQQSASPPKSSELGIKIEETYPDDDFYENKANNNNESSEFYESVQEQKLLNNAFDIISLIESSLQNSYDTNGSEKLEDKISSSYLINLLDENTAQFKIQLPQILLPKMHFVCEIGSRILFKTIDWLRDNQVWKYFEDEEQSEMLSCNWAELLIIGLG
jgi:nuclear receptor subfamily 2 group C